MNKKAEATFDANVVGKNVMTPWRQDVGYTRDGGIYELCEGTDFNHKPMWGVTVITIQDGRWLVDHDQSHLFGEGTTVERHEAALRYIREELQ